MIHVGKQDPIRFKTVALAGLIVVGLGSSGLVVAGRGEGRGKTPPQGSALYVDVQDGAFGSTTDVVIRSEPSDPGQIGEYDVRTRCNQEGVSVMSVLTRTELGAAKVLLGPTETWKGGHAECEAELVVYRGNRWRVEAMSPFLTWDISDLTTVPPATIGSSSTMTNITLDPTTTTSPITTTPPTSTTAPSPIITTTTTAPPTTTTTIPPTTTTTTITTTTTTTRVNLGGEGFVVPVAELLAKPMSGSGWEVLKSAADRQSYGVVDLGDQSSLTQSYVLAAALVYARTGDVTYRNKVIEYIRQVCGTQTDGPDPLLAVARTLFGYVAAAEIVGMPHSTNCNNGQPWDSFLRQIRTEVIPGHSRWPSLEITSADTSNNWGTYALSSHLAVSYALNDQPAINRDIEIFKRFLGDPSSTAKPFNPTAGYLYNGNGLTWDMNPTLRFGINPDSPGDPRSGALIEDVLRSSSVTSVACCAVQSAGVTYQEEALDGLLATSQLLRAHGTDLGTTGDQALRRAYEFLIRNGGPGPNSLTRYLPYAINHLYGTNHPTQTEDRPYRHLGYGSWLFTK